MWIKLECRCILQKMKKKLEIIKQEGLLRKKSPLAHLFLPQQKKSIISKKKKKKNVKINNEEGKQNKSKKISKKLKNERGALKKSKNKQKILLD